MSVLILAFVGGLLTILSPCILPVLPFVFARLGQPLVRLGTGSDRPHTFAIEFLDPGVTTYAFTFG
jgi:cytochrome c biogenesis protein CcdA